ncbi:hypothetical protein CHLRE_10g458700v5 [Chlamydomonas reinhardtii]|uniref:Uncharacterized protein n=1 Tax=Chlamydomonas reinhardtii TaxID=3055 RepID=A0A2K3DBR2_CHLRE|nr:uncharacterized protein CHLRE_10g458700v5 [Chlamydomonas reinhardtii]XP_042920511.1 uncharacterized protein CHLRE_10g458700v5 [Chlamydomonas reinhardtii]PNW77964.1 hypothetical protein CHLRE_10g458700v5 [Chlamydomonas reinhardtii]PNW77965.1 hypothetical protein CHLRE_10g458700v5 [Chlamydomonas reinhardtii]
MSSMKGAAAPSSQGEAKKHKHKVDPRIEAKIMELRIKAKEHLSVKQFEEALRCLDLAIDLHSTSYKLYRMRSIALSCLQQYERAAADADRVMELAPHIMDGYYHKGFALFHLKDYAGAAHAFQQGLKLNPTDKTLRQGFWDAIALVSQSRTEGGNEPELVPAGTAAAAAAAALAAAEAPASGVAVAAPSALSGAEGLGEGAMDGEGPASAREDGGQADGQ